MGRNYCHFSVKSAKYNFVSSHSILGFKLLKFYYFEDQKIHVPCLCDGGLDTGGTGVECCLTV